MPPHSYTVLLKYFKDDDAEGYSVVVPAFPGIVTWGRTVDEAEANAREALECHVRGMIKDGDPLPEDITVDEPFRISKIEV